MENSTYTQKTPKDGKVVEPDEIIFGESNLQADSLDDHEPEPEQTQTPSQSTGLTYQNLKKIAADQLIDGTDEQIEALEKMIKIDTKKEIPFAYYSRFTSYGFYISFDLNDVQLLYEVISDPDTKQLFEEWGLFDDCKSLNDVKQVITDQEELGLLNNEVNLNLIKELADNVICLNDFELTVSFEEIYDAIARDSTPLENFTHWYEIINQPELDELSITYYFKFDPPQEISGKFENELNEGKIMLGEDNNCLAGSGVNIDIYGTLIDYLTEQDDEFTNTENLLTWKQSQYGQDFKTPKQLISKVKADRRTLQNYIGVSRENIFEYTNKAWELVHNIISYQQKTF